MKTLVIGLDGATWRLLKPWAASGKLPTIKRLMENGSWGVLESTIPPWTIPAWESMATGKAPARLGFATFMVRQGYSFKPYTALYKPEPRIWDYLSAAGHGVVVANAPNIHEAYPVNGCMVAGWLYTDPARLTYPGELINELRSCCGYEVDIFRVDPETGEIIGEPETDEEYIERVEELLEKHTRAFTYLLRSCRWSHAFLVYVTTDRLQHRFWREDVLLKHYKHVDQALEALLEAAGEDTNVFIVSDHGFGPANLMLNINELLMRHGYLVVKRAKRRTAARLVELLRRTRLLPLAKMLVKRLPRGLAEKAVRQAAQLSLNELEIDWERTKAFAYAALGDIYLNLRGREPSGALTLDEYYRTRSEIIKLLQSLTYNGKKLNIKALAKEEAFPGSSIHDNLPDIIVLPTDDGIQEINPNIGLGEPITDISAQRRGNHRIDGIILAHGPWIRRGHRLQRARIIDVAPTILHLHGLPLPADMDGEPLTEIYRPGTPPAAPPKRAQPQYYRALLARQALRARIRRKLAERKATDGGAA